MSIAEFLPIYVGITLAIFAIAYLVIINIRTKYTYNKEPDLLEKIIDKKKRELNSNIGGMSFNLYVALMILIPIIVTTAVWIFIKRPTTALILGLISAGTPEVIIRLSKTRQKQNFEERYARALKALSSSLESGLSIQQAVEELINNAFIHDSIRRGFSQIDADIKIGLSVPQAFKKFAEETKSEDAEDVASAIAMQSKVGGSEAKVIANIANNINDRIMMRKEIKTLFTDVTLLVKAMDILPYLVIGGLYLFAPSLITPFFESPTRILLFIGIILWMVVGSFFIHTKLNAAKGGKL